MNEKNINKDTPFKCTKCNNPLVCEGKFWTCKRCNTFYVPKRIR